jgi:hypothetical protein
MKQLFKKDIDGDEKIFEYQSSADGVEMGYSDPITSVDADQMVTNGEAILHDSHEDMLASLGYMNDRRSAYSDIKEQLDYIYNHGLTKWKSDMIKPVKGAHPKPE